MPKIHPDEPTLYELADVLRSAGLGKVVSHVAECPRCLETLLAQLANRPKSSRPATVARILPWPGCRSEKANPSPRGVDEFQARIAAFEQERKEAKDLWTEISNQSEGRREMVLRHDPRAHTWGLVEILLDESRDLTFDDCRLAERLAERAFEQVATLDRDFYGESRIADLRARCWGRIANARRIRSDLRGAEAAFVEAESQLRSGTHDPLERALMLDLKASLKRDQRHLDEAARLLHRAIEIFEDAGEKHRVGRSMFALANVYHMAGETERAIAEVQRALPMIDTALEPNLEFLARHNLITMLTEAGHFMEARRLLGESMPLYRRFPELWAKNRLSWVEGNIEAGLGQFESAERHLLASRDGFVDQGIAFDAALVSLDLAMVYARWGRHRELGALAQETLAIFRSLAAHPEALAALSFLATAAEQEVVSLEIIRNVAEFFRRAQVDPEVRFDPNSTHLKATSR